MMRRVASIALFFLTTAAFAAIKLPEASPGASISRNIGIGEVRVHYHSPAVKGRTIWGGLVPYDKVWRLGANNATTIVLSHPARVGGVDVPAGKYALFAIPGKSEWTIIVNKQPEQWGAYFHKATDDVARFRVKPQTLSSPVEWMQVSIQPVSEFAAEVALSWERLRVPFLVEMDVPAIVWKQIDQEIATAKEADWETFHQAARYALNTGKRLDEAMKWIDIALKHESFWNYELKARLLHAKGRTAEAYPLMEKAKVLARGKAPDEYVTGLNRTVAEWRAGKTK